MRGVDALNDIAGDLPDLILVDIMLLGLDGFEVCKRLKMSDKPRHIPVIFLTGKNSQADILRGKQVGGDQYVTKPFKSVSLLRTIHQLFKDKESASEKYKFYIKLNQLFNLLTDQALPQQELSHF